MRTTITLLAGLGFLACAPAPAPPRKVPEGVQQPQDSTRVATPGAAVSTADTNKRPSPSASVPPLTAPSVPQGPSAAGLVGVWEISPTPPTRGPHLSIVIDSATGPAFHGRLTRALSGDVEASGNYRPFTGTLGSDGVARARIDGMGKDISPIIIAGTVNDGTWMITSLVWGEELVTKTTAWKALKVR